MCITINFKFLLIFLFLLLKNVNLHQINTTINYSNDDEITDSVVSQTTSSTFILEHTDKYDITTIKYSHQQIQSTTNNSEAFKLSFNKENYNSSTINYINSNISTNNEVPNPFKTNYKHNNNNNNNDYDNYDDINDNEELNSNFESLQSKNLDTSDDTFTFRHFGLFGNSNHKSKTSKKPSLLRIALKNAARIGLEAMNALYERTEPDILRKRQILGDNHPGAKLARFNAPHDDTLLEAEKAAFANLEATKSFQRSYKRTTTELGRQATSTKFSFRRTALEGLCPPRQLPVCLPAAKRYRTHDGTCNNIKHPRWGSAQMPFNRFLPPEYGDGIDTVRTSVEGGGALSSARFVSLLVHGAREGNAPVTLILAQWGQLIDHDLTSTAQPRSINGSIPRCCGPNDFHPSCFPIKVPLDDPWLAPLKVHCLEFLRSAPAQRRDCVMSWREQTNQVTSYLDASPIYSSNARTSDSARVFRHGLLQFGRGNPTEDVCTKGAFSPNCIKSGDPRSNEQPGLLALHHVWVGEHNRIAGELSQLNPQWSDEKVYQETRRIVGALFQHITYREFLPLVLGREVCRLFDLDLLNSGFYSGYDPHINPTVANSFSAAAFRFGHSLIPNSYIRCDQGHNMIQNNVSLHEEFAHGDLGTRGSLHRLIRGMVNQRALQRDEFITPELTNHLFQTGSFPFGLDLAAINIQRGRDHGIPPYTVWREPCGLSPINDWDDLNHVVGPESVRRMRHAYISVHDIDLFVGGIAERAVIGGLVGPTFACIIAQQFSNLRRGDRFWYENGGFDNSFTPAQLNSIRRVSLAQILCRAIGDGTFQPHIFIPHEAENNQRLPCGVDLLAPIDLRPWNQIDPFKNSVADEPLIMSPLSNDVPLPLPHNKETENDDKLMIADPEISTLDSTKMTENKNEKDPKASNIPLNRIDFVPNGSTGFHRPLSDKNLQNKINDKLDFLNNKRTTKRTPILNIPFVDNKLDSKLKFKSTTNSPTMRVTTKRKAFVNNVQIELGRTVLANKTNRQKNVKQIIEQVRRIDIIEDSKFDIQTNKLTEKHTNLTNKIFFEKTNKLTDRVNNKNDKIFEETKDNLKNIDFTDFSNSKKNDQKNNIGEILQINESKNITTLTDNVSKNKVLCEKFKKNITITNATNLRNDRKHELVNTLCPNDRLPILNMTNKRNESLELRNANYDEDNTKNGGNLRNQQYEIEINIRKSNKNRNTGTPFIRDITPQNLNVNRIPIRKDYPFLHQQQTLEHSPFSYKPTGQMQQYNINTKIPSLQTTKPPKIYYVADDDDPFNSPEKTTSRPGFLDNFLPSITGSFSGLFNTIQNFNQNSATTADPTRLILTLPNRRHENTHLSGTLINGIIQENPNQGHPVSFQPILPSNIGFDQNSNKKPDSFNNNIQSGYDNSKPFYGNMDTSFNYNEYIPNNWNNYMSPSLLYSTTPSSFYDTRITTRSPYYDRPEPNYRPGVKPNYQQTQNHYNNFEQHKPYYRYGPDLTIEHKNLDIKLEKSTTKSLSRMTKTGITLILGKNIEQDKLKTTKIPNNENYEDIDYYDNELEAEPTEHNINEQFDKDGYLRPEHNLPNVQTAPPIFNKSQTTLNDNFVMPVLLDKTELKKITLETLPRSPMTDIKAETDIKINTAEHIKNTIISSTKILQQDENGTNDNISPLPILPELKVNEQESTNEFPKPINTTKWQKKFTLKNC